MAFGPQHKDLDITTLALNQGHVQTYRLRQSKSDKVLTSIRICDQRFGGNFDIRIYQRRYVLVQTGGDLEV